MIMNRNPLALAGTAERLAMNEVNRAAVVAGDPERAARVAAYDRARRFSACVHCGGGHELAGSGEYRLAHRASCAVAEPWAALARRAQRAWGADQGRADGAVRAIWPHVVSGATSADEVVEAGCLGRLGRLQDRLVGR